MLVIWKSWIFAEKPLLNLIENAFIITQIFSDTCIYVYTWSAHFLSPFHGVTKEPGVWKKTLLPY